MSSPKKIEFPEFDTHILLIQPRLKLMSLNEERVKNRKLFKEENTTTKIEIGQIQKKIETVNMLIKILATIDRVNLLNCNLKTIEDDHRAWSTSHRIGNIVAYFGIGPGRARLRTISDTHKHLDSVKSELNTQKMRVKPHGFTERNLPKLTDLHSLRNNLLNQIFKLNSEIRDPDNQPEIDFGIELSQNELYAGRKLLLSIARENCAHKQPMSGRLGKQWPEEAKLLSKEIGAIENASLPFIPDEPLDEKDKEALRLAIRILISRIVPTTRGTMHTDGSDDHSVNR